MFINTDTLSQAVKGNKLTYFKILGGNTLMDVRLIDKVITYTSFIKEMQYKQCKRL